MGFLAVISNQANCTGAGKVRIKHIAWGDFLLVDASEAKSAASERILFHGSTSSFRIKQVLADFVVLYC